MVEPCEEVKRLEQRYEKIIDDTEKHYKEVLDKIRVEIEQLPTKSRTNWDGCCPDINYPEIEYIDVTKNKLLSIIDKYKSGSETRSEQYEI